MTNPRVVDVLSTSTEDYDRGEKREHYQRIESLKEYVLIAQDCRSVEVFSRGQDGAWSHRVHGAGDSVALPSLGVGFEADELYDAAGLQVR